MSNYNCAVTSVSLCWSTSLKVMAVSVIFFAYTKPPGKYTKMVHYLTILISENRYVTF